MKHYKLIIIIQSLTLVLLSATASILVYKGYWFSAGFILILLIITLLALVGRQQKINDNVRKMIDSIRVSDYSLAFNTKKNREIDVALAREMNEALQIFKERMYKIEEQDLFYNTLLSTIDSGLLVLQQGGVVKWYNDAVLTTFGITGLKSVCDLSKIDSDLPEFLGKLRPGEIQLFRFKRNEEIREIAFNTILFRLQEENLFLISMKNVRAVLEQNEVEAWKKLIRVLTHEIMNSLAPIISLSETLTERSAGSEVANGESSVITQAMAAIHRRSKGLLEFVQNYRRLTRIPPPELEEVKVKELFSDLAELHRSDEIVYRFDCKNDNLLILADRVQIEQVLINMIRNAEEAVEGKTDPYIELVAKIGEVSGEVTITVKDNGTGIVPEALEKIFVPFFTTKSGGSGVGLSICKQIMVMHKGNITATSEIDKGSCFTLHFRSN